MYKNCVEQPGGEIRFEDEDGTFIFVNPDSVLCEQLKEQVVSYPLELERRLEVQRIETERLNRLSEESRVQLEETEGDQNPN